MYISIPKNGFHFNESQIKIIEDKYNGKYLGYWCTKRLSGGWNDIPVDVFYVKNPDRSKGHSNFFGMFRDDKSVMITNAESCFEKPVIGLLCHDGEVLVSRYRHDYRTKGSIMVDGGRDYLRCSAGKRIQVTVENGEFVCMELADA